MTTASEPEFTGHTKGYEDGFEVEYGWPYEQLRRLWRRFRGC